MTKTGYITSITHLLEAAARDLSKTDLYDLYDTIEDITSMWLDIADSLSEKDIPAITPKLTMDEDGTPYIE